MQSMAVSAAGNVTSSAAATSTTVAGVAAAAAATTATATITTAALVRSIIESLIADHPMDFPSLTTYVYTACSSGRGGYRWLHGRGRDSSIKK